MLSTRITRFATSPKAKAGRKEGEGTDIFIPDPGWAVPRSLFTLLIVIPLIFPMARRCSEHLIFVSMMVFHLSSLSDVNIC